MGVKKCKIWGTRRLLKIIVETGNKQERLMGLKQGFTLAKSLGRCLLLGGQSRKCVSTGQESPEVLTTFC